jgi:MFS transporter, DHA1 family, tetracycline resistance protein
MKPVSRQRLSLIIILTIVLLSGLGMSLIFPVIPYLVEPYAGSPSSLALWVGILEAAYAACALFAAPFLGSLSDRIGRKPVLVISLAGSALAWTIFGIGGALWVFLAARLVAGVFGGDLSVAFAYLADITPAEERAKRFGLAGAMVGVGTLVGPALGGLLSPIGLAVPVFATAGITALTAVLALVALPESLAEERRSDEVNVTDLNPIPQVMAAARRPGMPRLIAGFAVLSLTMSMFVSNVAVLALDAVGWQPVQLGALLSAVGLTDIIVQGVLLSFLIKLFGERGVIFGGLAGIAVASGLLVLVGSLAATGALLVAGGLLYATAEGSTTATLQGVLSQNAGDDEQGSLAGGLSAAGSATQLVGPLLAGVLYSQISRTAPYFLGIVLIVVTMAVLVPSRTLQLTSARTAADPAA